MKKSTLKTTSKLENFLKNKNQYYKWLYDNYPSPVFILDLEGFIIDINPAVFSLTGYTENEIKYNSFYNIIHFDDLPEALVNLKKAVNGQCETFDFRIVHKKGDMKYVRMTTASIIIDNEVIGIYSSIKDLTDIKQLEKELKISKKNLAESQKIAKLGSWEVDISNQKMVYCSDELYRILGTTPIEFDSSYEQFRGFIHPDDLPLHKKAREEATKKGHYDLVYRIIRKDGSKRIVHSKGKIKFDENSKIVRIIGTMQDITERKLLEEDLQQMAYYDYLTNLPNRRLLKKHLQFVLEQGKQNEDKFGLLLLNINQFKIINYYLGYSKGDRVLKEIADRLKLCIDGDNFIARLSGNQFVILSSNIIDIKIIEKICEKIIDLFEEPFLIDGLELFVDVRIGASIYPYDGEDVHSLMKNTNIAMRYAKKQGCNTYCIYTPTMNIEKYKQFTLRNDLHKAIQEEQFLLHYQPQIDSKTDEIIGVEALIRWNHPDWGIIMPNEFIPLAEEIGLIIPIGEWVLRTACMQNKSWQKKGLPLIKVSVNFSSLQLMKNDIYQTIVEILNETELDPKWLEIEITQSEIIKNERNLKVIKKLKDIGIKIALNDFGTGYSSLSYLKKIELDTLKIDKSFIKDIESDSYNLKIVKSIIRLAQDININTVAEGVETAEQLSLLHKIQCENIQGYLYSKPISSEELEVLLINGKCCIKSNKEPYKEPLEDKRKFFRIDLSELLGANMTILRIGEKDVEVGDTEILIKDIGPGGLRVLSDIKLPIKKNIILGFETEILNQTVQLNGYVVWKRNLAENVYEYGIKFIVDEIDRQPITMLLNQLQIHLKHNRYFPNYRLVSKDNFKRFVNK